MNALPAVVDSNNRRVPLEALIGAGGEGAAYTVAGNVSIAVKVYKPGSDKRSPTQEAKLQAMRPLNNARLKSIAAWPETLLYDAHSRQFVGFSMPRFSDCHPIQCLYNPIQRLKSFPKASWTFQLRAAINLAAAFDEVHNAGCLVGDVNQGNALVTSQALVRLIDCDSFQLQSNGKSYLCEVGVAHFTPPELQGKSFRGLMRTQNHDRFGMAVLIYQLLFAGRHPYMGMHKDESPFEQLIADFRFSQGPDASKWGMAPPPHTPIFQDFSAEIGSLFRKSFERGSERGSRPRPIEWLSVLKQFETQLIECPTDSGHKYWRGAGSCTWCRIANRGGPEYYFGAASSADSFSVDERKLQDILRRLEAARLPELRYERTAYAPRQRTLLFGAALPAELVSLAEERIRHRKYREEVEERAANRVVECENRCEQALREVKKKAAQQIKPLDGGIQEWRRVVDKEQAGRLAISSAIHAMTILGCLVTPIALVFGNRTAVGIGTALILSILIEIGRVLFFRSDAERGLAAAMKERAQIVAQGKRAVKKIKSEHAAEDAALRKSIQIERMNAQQVLQHIEQAYQQRADAEMFARKEQRNRAEQRLNASEKYWQDEWSVLQGEHARVASSVATEVTECRGLAGKFQAEFDQLIAKATDAGLVRHLRLHHIADANISGIGAGRLSVLLASGIATASDIDQWHISKLSGFGDVLTNALMNWKRQVISEYRFNKATAVSPTETRQLTVKYQSMQQKIISTSNQRVINLEVKAKSVRAAIAQIIPGIKAAIESLEQADADLRILE